MNYVTTNIRLFKEDYDKLKEEAARKRKSLSAVIREKLTAEKGIMTEKNVSILLRELDQLAERNGKKLKNWNALQSLREIRSTK